jgi:hypothetical protein
MSAEFPSSHWQYRSEVRCKSCRGQRRSNFVRPARFLQKNSCSAHNPWQSRFGLTPESCVRSESCGPTLGVRRCHLPYLKSCLPHSLLSSETVDLAMSVAPPSISTDFLARGRTRWAKRSLSDRAKSPRLSDFPNTLFEAFPIAFRYGESKIFKRIFLLLGWFNESRRRDGPNAGG